MDFSDSVFAGVGAGDGAVDEAFLEPLGDALQAFGVTEDTDICEFDACFTSIYRCS